MAAVLPILEGAWMFLVVCVTAYVSAAYHGLTAWPAPATVAVQATTLSLSAVGALYYNGLYDVRLAGVVPELWGRLFRAVLITGVFVAAVCAWFPGARVRELPLAAAVVLIAFVPLRRAACRIIRSQPFVERVLMVGGGELAELVVRELQARSSLPYTIIGVVDDATDSEVLARYPLLGPLAQLPKIIEEIQPERLVIALAQRRGRLSVGDLLPWRAAGMAIEHAADFYERIAGKVALEWLWPSTLIYGRGIRVSRLGNAVRRGVSLVVAVVGLVVFAPALAVIALAIKLDSGGPVFFVQRRQGARGRAFTLVKFRTMRPSASDGSEWARDHAQRITRLGKWLRRFRLDELPQFINMLRGDMNLVGPRPHPVSNIRLFSEKIPFYALRSAIPPGVTGWAQVRYGYANNLEEEIEKMRYDLYYIKHASFWLDVRILIDTIKTVFLGRGALAADADQVVPRERRLDPLKVA
jgi:exopolysaccharide biosynthesis polyprenyl glycosylphosphotransferase